MKVKELLARMGLENPESQVVPGRDGDGNMTLTVLPPEHPLGEPIHNNEEARKTLAGHLDRVERIRTAIASFYGLPVLSRIDASPHSEWVEFTVKSPTGKTMTIAQISVKYVVRHNEYGWQQEQVGFMSGSGSFQRFKDTSPDLTGYACSVHKYVLTGDKLAGAVQKLCEAPKWLEVHGDDEG
jgi:hypothetical protein